MRLVLDGAASSVEIDLRATGPLAVLGHDPTLTARPGPGGLTIDVGDGPPAAIDAPVVLRFAVDAIEPPVGIPASDREKMRDNMLSRDVLDAARFPAIDLRARYTGGLERGTLAGELVVRGAPRRVTIPIQVARDGTGYTAAGVWEGRLTDLGVRPFKALLGALKLDDWLRIRLAARFTA